ncbi:MAG TPA: N-acetylmuramoyl-L-alanine amidase [Gemmatimonadaceae bacterium]|nr:N-acetylmuramoyl-L-alanine amidase [Gemmatimonadaceae bacterium]
MSIPSVPVSQVRHSHVLQQPLAAPRSGIMLHYDDSSRDDWALAWFDDPRCTNGYTWLALDDGGLAELADPGMRTPHAGACLTTNPNSAYYGLSAATNGLVPVTARQLATIIATCVALFRFHSWPAPSVDERIVGHDAQAIWTPTYTRAAGMSDAAGARLWGTLGRKVDPTGVRKDHQPILDVAAVRREVRQRLDSRGAPQS